MSSWRKIKNRQEIIKTYLKQRQIDIYNQKKNNIWKITTISHHQHQHNHQRIRPMVGIIIVVTPNLNPQIVQLSQPNYNCAFDVIPLPSEGKLYAKEKRKNWIYDNS
jgi:hypothetical protein